MNHALNNSCNRPILHAVRFCTCNYWPYIYYCPGCWKKKCVTLMSLSTFMRGAQVAVKNQRLSGLQPNATAQWLDVDPIIFLRFTSQKSISPAKLPRPASRRNLPWGLQLMVFRWALQNSNVGSPWVYDQTAQSGTWKRIICMCSTWLVAQ